MTQTTRHWIANILLAAAGLIVLIWIAGWFMTPARPAWTKDYILVGFVLTVFARLIRGSSKAWTTEPSSRPPSP